MSDKYMIHTHCCVLRIHPMYAEIVEEEDVARWADITRGDDGYDRYDFGVELNHVACQFQTLMCHNVPFSIAYHAKPIGEYTHAS